MAKRNSKRRAWTSADVRELKSAARNKTPARKIARSLKRSEGATRQKAFSLGLSLDSRGVKTSLSCVRRLAQFNLLEMVSPSVTPEAWRNPLPARPYPRTCLCHRLRGGHYLPQLFLFFVLTRQSLICRGL